MTAAAHEHNTPILHLVAPPSIQPSRTHFGRAIPTLLLAGALRDSLTPPPPLSRIIIVGDSTTKSTASALGLDFTDHYAPLLSNTKSIKRTVLSRLSSTTTTPSRIICWSDELALLAASLATHYDIPAELISTNPSTISKPRHSFDSIRVFEPQDHDWWLDHRHTCRTDQLLSAVIDPIEFSNERRAAARTNLNIDPDTIVLAAVADNPAQVDAREFAFLLGLLAVSGYQVLGIVPNTAKNLDQALRHHRGLDQPFRLMTTTDQLPDLLPLLDACIHPTDQITGSTQLINRYIERADIPILSLRHSGKAGFTRAQGTANHLLDQMDQIKHTMQSQLTNA